MRLFSSEKSMLCGGATEAVQEIILKNSLPCSNEK